MSLSNQHGTASLSRPQRKQFQEFKRKNAKRLKGIMVMQMVQIWRDGFICGAIHGMEMQKKFSAANS